MNMRRIFFIAVLMLPMVVWASQVTLPNVFVPGQRARAGDVNNNFDAVKDAVDDNDERVTELESRVPELGAVSLSAHAFHGISSSCPFTRLARFGFFDTAAGNCNAFAPLSLPHNSIITDASCFVFDNEDAENIGQIEVLRMSLATDTDDQALFDLDAPTTDFASPILRNLTNLATGGNLVDNTTYSYYLKVTFNNNGIANTQNLRLYSCKVGYTRGNL
jgi:hypothetical protein